MWYICKCGNEEELDDMEQAICRLCKRRGCWMPNEEEPHGLLYCEYKDGEFTNGRRE